VGAEEIRAFRAANVARLTLAGVIDMAIFQVTPEYVRELAAQGHRDLATAQVIDMWRSRARR